VPLTVAFPVEELLQVPPAVPEDDNVVVPATQSVALPIIAPADGVILTVTVLVAATVPHPFVDW
jgi:hypothetical protein